MPTATPDNPIAQRLDVLLRTAGLPIKYVDAFGTRVIVTCYGEATARRVVPLLQAGSFTIEGVIASQDDVVGSEHAFFPVCTPVWRVHARVIA